jgi:photosystem II stability/assembly factor-like uncharacterized protein
VTVVKKPAQLVAATAAFLILGSAAGAVPGRAYVLWTGSKVYVTEDGQAWRQVTPRGAVGPGTFRAIDAVAFRGTREGWLIASDCATGRGSTYRSFDGGRSWRAYAFHGHSCAAGANFSLDVLNDKQAWVLQNEPTGPTARLYRTTDGGRSWQVVRRLAEYGKVAFVSPTRGWLAGLRLLRTADGGRTWHLQPLPAPRGYHGRLVLLTAPHFFGRYGEVAGQYGGGKPVIGFYRTGNGGRRWRLAATLPGSTPGLFPQFALSAVSASASWVLTAGVNPAVHVTHDGGRHWSSHALVRKLYAPVALSARVAAASDFRGRPYITRDGGRSWRRLSL